MADTPALLAASEAKASEAKSSTVALVDVDDTLISGSCITDSDDGIEQITSKLEKEGVLNLNLMNALKAANVLNVYLFTDMTLNKMGLLERRALVEILKKQGFIVHGVMTPADCAWHLPLEQLKSFCDSEAAQLPRKIYDAKNNGEEDTANQLLHTLQQNEHYKNLVAAQEPDELANPGRAFQAAEDVINDQKSLDASTLLSKYTKFFADTQSCLANMSHVKGKMFQYLINHNHHGFKKFIVCDDRADVLESIKQANNVDTDPNEVVTIYVNNNAKKKSPAEQIKNRAFYLNEITASAVLSKACTDYATYLEGVIKKYNDNKKDDGLVLARKKLHAITQMQPLLQGTVGRAELEAFRAKFIEHRGILEQRRDSWGMWFLKVIATTLSIGIAAAFGIWNVKGKEMAKTLELPLSNLPKLKLGAVAN